MVLSNDEFSVLAQIIKQANDDSVESMLRAAVEGRPVDDQIAVAFVAALRDAGYEIVRIKPS